MLCPHSLHPLLYTPRQHLLSTTILLIYTLGMRSLGSFAEEGCICLENKDFKRFVEERISRETNFTCK
jgi:hypothetical protein